MKTQDHPPRLDDLALAFDAPGKPGYSEAFCCIQGFELTGEFGVGIIIP